MLELLWEINNGYDPMLILGTGGLGYKPHRDIIGQGKKKKTLLKEFQNFLSQINPNIEEEQEDTEEIVEKDENITDELENIILNINNASPEHLDLLEERIYELNDKGKIDDNIFNALIESIGNRNEIITENTKQQNLEKEKSSIEQWIEYISDLIGEKKVPEETEQQISADDIISEVEVIHDEQNVNRGVAFENWIIDYSEYVFDAINDILTVDNKSKLDDQEDIVQYSSYLPESVKDTNTAIDGKNLKIGDLLPIDLSSKDAVFECKYFINKDASDPNCEVSIQTTKLVGGSKTDIYYVYNKDEKKYKYYGTYSNIPEAEGWIKEPGTSISNKGKDYYLTTMLNNGMYVTNLNLQPNKDNDFYYSFPSFPLADKPYEKDENPKSYVTDTKNKENKNKYPQLYKMRLYGNDRPSVEQQQTIKEEEIYSSNNADFIDDNDNVGVKPTMVKTGKKSVSFNVSQFKKLNLKK
jgi:hypothetical protein